MRGDQCGNVSHDVLSTWELSATPLQLRVEQLYLGESSELIQKFVVRSSSGRATPLTPHQDQLSTVSSKDDKTTDIASSDHSTVRTEIGQQSITTTEIEVPIILGIRAFAQLVMENKIFCDPLISDMGHLEILPLKRPSHLPVTLPSVANSPVSSQPPLCYIVNFSSVFTFPLNLADLALDSRIELSFVCVDLGVEIGKISLQIFSTTGVLRQGRFLLPFSLTPLKLNSNGDRDECNLSSRCRQHRGRNFSSVTHSLQGVCAHCAASSRFVSHLGCLDECSNVSSRGGHSDWSDSSHVTESDESPLPSQTTTQTSVPSAQSVVSSFLGDRRRPVRCSNCRWHRRYRASDREEVDKVGGENKTSTASPRKSASKSCLDKLKSCNSTNNNHSNTSVDASTPGPSEAESYHTSCYRSLTSSSSNKAHQSPILSPSLADENDRGIDSNNEEEDGYSDGILVSSGSVTCWSSSVSLDERSSLSSESEGGNPERRRITEDGDRKQEVTCIRNTEGGHQTPPITSRCCTEGNSGSLHDATNPPPVTRGSSFSDDGDSFLMIPSGSETTGERRRMHSSQPQIPISDKQKSNDESPFRRHTRAKRRRPRRRIRLQSFRGILRSVYRAMNCYKLLDLSKRGVIAKCPYTKDVCRVQVQLQCEKNLMRGLLYYGFTAICLSVFPTPVVFSTTPPQRSAPDFSDTEEKPQHSKYSSWLGGGASLPSLGVSSSGEGAPSTAGRLSQLSSKRVVYSTIDPTILLDARQYVSRKGLYRGTFGRTSNSSRIEVDRPLINIQDTDEEDQEFGVHSSSVRRRYSLPLSETVSLDHAMMTDKCAQLYLGTYEVSSAWQTRRSLLAMAHNIVVQNSLNEQSAPILATLTSDREDQITGCKPASVPSSDIYETSDHKELAEFLSWQQSTSSNNNITQSMVRPGLSNSAWAPTSSITAASSTLTHHTHQMHLLRACWSSPSESSIRDQHCPLERLYLKQQRKLTIAAMDRQRTMNESALEDGRINFSGLASLSPPQISEYQMLNATLSLTSLTPADKRLLWKHRETLKTEGVSVLKLAGAVDWSTMQQPKEFAKLLETWPLPPIEGTLELLSSLSPIPTVRHFSCCALEAASDSDICRYLPQLVQAIRYDIPGPNAPILSVLLRRASLCPRIASALQWGLQCESEDSEKGHLFIRGHQRLLETLAKTSEGSIGRRILKILELQRRFAVALRSLATRIRDRKDRADRKTERLRELLVASSSLSSLSLQSTTPASTSSLDRSSDVLQLTNLQQPVPLPIAPYGLLLGIVPEKSHVVKSSQYPLVLACRVLVPPSYQENSEQSTFNYSTGDYDNAEIHELWEAGVIGIGKLKEKGYKEILKKYLFKTGDDLRQDQLVTQIIRIIRDLLASYGSDYRLTIYDVIAFSRSDGLVEFVEKSDAISSIKKSYPTLRHYFAAYSAESHGPLGFPKVVLDTFIRSCSGYSVITFLLGVGDRHLDNLLLCEDGRLVHVDFGFILGDDPKPFPPPMKLCPEMIEGLGGIGSEGYTTFQLMCCQCFRCIRRHSKLILDVLLMMAHSGIKGLRTDPLGVITRVQEKFQLDVPEVKAEAFLLDIIGISANALFPVVVDKFHEWALYWK